VVLYLLFTKIESQLMSRQVDRKVLVVTGASSGIGEAVVRYAAQQGVFSWTFG
jgi:hypothetical protein